MTEWMRRVKKMYSEKHAKNPDYTFTDAMKDAKVGYKSKSTTSHKRSRSRGGKRRRHRSTRRRHR